MVEKFRGAMRSRRFSFPIASDPGGRSRSSLKIFHLPGGHGDLAQGEFGLNLRGEHLGRISWLQWCKPVPWAWEAFRGRHWRLQMDVSSHNCYCEYDLSHFLFETFHPVIFATLTFLSVTAVVILKATSLFTFWVSGSSEVTCRYVSCFCRLLYRAPHPLNSSPVGLTDTLVCRKIRV